MKKGRRGRRGREREERERKGGEGGEGERKGIKREKLTTHKIPLAMRSSLHYEHGRI